MNDLTRYHYEQTIKKLEAEVKLLQIKLLTEQKAKASAKFEINKPSY